MCIILWSSLSFSSRSLCVLDRGITVDCSRRWGYSIIGIAKEVASPRTDAPETPTLQRAISTQSKIQLSRREEQLILGPTRALQTHFSHFSRLCLHLGCAHDVTTTSHPHTTLRATFAPSSHRDATDAWASSGRRSEPSSELLHPTREGPPLSDRSATLLEAPGRALALSGRGRTRSQCMRPGSRKGKDGAAGKAGSLVLLPRAKWHHSSQIATKDGSNGVTLRSPRLCWSSPPAPKPTSGSHAGYNARQAGSRHAG